MKKIICALMIVCTAFFTVSCAFKNEETANYTLNAVVAGVKDTDDGVTVELLPVIPCSPYSDIYSDSDITPVYGYIRYEGTGGHNGSASRWNVRSENPLSYKLRRHDKAKELLEFADGMIVKFTVMDGVIYRFENTGCVFVEDDSWKYWDDDLYNWGNIYD